jgi:hypothetical protein
VVDVAVLAHRLHDAPGPLHPTVADRPLVVLGPPLADDRRAGEVDDGVGLRRQLERALFAWVPADLVGALRVAGDDGRLVAALAEPSNEVGADQSGSAGDDHVHG